MQNITDIKKLTSDAKALLAEMNAAEVGIEAGFESAIDRAWRFGKALNAIKTAVPHGQWESYRASAFPKLDDRRAQMCMKLDRDNPKAQKSADLSAESRRKFRFGYVPVKDRPKAAGNVRFKKPTHHSTVVNECNTYAQRVRSGHLTLTREVLEDFEAFYFFLRDARSSASLPL